MQSRNGSPQFQITAASAEKYGFTEEMLGIFQGMFEAAMYFDSHRIPELFCDFVRNPGDGPVLYRSHARLNRGRQPLGLAGAAIYGPGAVSV